MILSSDGNWGLRKGIRLVYCLFFTGIHVHAPPPDDVAGEVFKNPHLP